MMYRTAILIACVSITLSGCGKAASAVFKAISRGGTKAAPKLAPLAAPRVAPLVAPNPARGGGFLPDAGKEVRPNFIEMGGHQAIRYGLNQLGGDDQKKK